MREAVCSRALVAAAFFVAWTVATYWNVWGLSWAENLGAILAGLAITAGGYLGTVALTRHRVRGTRPMRTAVAWTIAVAFSALNLLAALLFLVYFVAAATSGLLPAAVYFAGLVVLSIAWPTRLVRWVEAESAPELRGSHA